MKIECEIEFFKKAVMQADKATSKNAALPILTTILFETGNNSITLKSTNLSLGVEITIPAIIHTKGAVAIPSQTILNSILGNISKGKIILELIDNNISLTTKQNTSLIKTIPHNDFPIIPHIEGSSFTILAEKIINGIKNVSYSASVSDIKPEISSVYIYPDNEDIVFVSTDTFRLAEKKIKAITPDFNGFLIPFKNINDLVRIFNEIEGEISVLFNTNQIAFKGKGIYCTSRIIDGVFPDYHQIIPKKHETQAIILKQDIIDALKVATVFSDKFNQITFTINPKDALFEVSSKNSDVGETNTSLIASLEGNSIITHINYRYLFDCFQSITDDSISIEFSGANKPIIIKGINDHSFTYLIMPMNR